MNGLFLRLATQASGQRSATLRSPAALPFQGVPERVEPLESTTDLPDLSRVQAAATEQPASTSGHATAARLAARPPHRLPDSEAMNPQVPDKQTPAVAPRVFQAHDEPATASPLPNQEPKDTHAPFALAVPPGLIMQPMRTAPVSFSAQQADAASLQNPRQTTAGHASSPRAGSANNQSAVIEDPVFEDDSAPLPLPAALISPRTVAPRQAVAAAPLASAPPTPSSQTDEVHIHIGRIEVTAIQESAPSKRASRKGTAPLSLDDYLAKRKGDSR